jgi:hypothetical protein
MRRLICSSCLASAVLASGACAVSVDKEAHIEREQKRFDANGLTDVHLYTFDGNVEVTAWDRPEVVVDVEKRGEDKEAVAKVQLVADRTGKRVQVEARHTGSGGRVVAFASFTSTTARLTAKVPREVNLVVRTGDGAIVVERMAGRLELRTEDGNIRVLDAPGDLLAESGDGAIECDGVSGRVEARTNDGTVRIAGTPSVVRARSGDGDLVLRIRRGATMADNWLVATQDGSISVELPEDFDADIEADPGSDGRARSEFTLINVSGGTRTERTLRGRLGNGGRSFVLRTSDGSIRILRY